MKVKLKGGHERELWDISYTHLRCLIPLKKKSFLQFKKHYQLFMNAIPRTAQIKRQYNRNKKRSLLEIKFLERELEYRENYKDYRTFCELFVVGVNEPNPDRPHSRIHKTVRQDESFLLSFAGWCEDHNMMVQSRKLMRLIDRIKMRENRSFTI